MIDDSNCVAGCAKCVMLEEQLEIKSEEIRRLKEGTTSTLLQMIQLQMSAMLNDCHPGRKVFKSFKNAM